MKYCLACHQAEGSGVPGMYPPLVKTEWVQGDRTTLIRIILNGQQGEIEVNGRIYKGTMPAHQYLSDKQVADLLTFLRSNFGNKADAITPEEVAAVRKSP
jgi:mono/diheme cytochrome c family protein